MNNVTSVIIRLQRLPWEATSADVREFFRGLHIPDGGVHIVGGRDGDAFIAFSTDEDARQAMRLDGRRIKTAKVKLLLSSRIEMQQVIDKARVELQQGLHQSACPDSGRDKSAGIAKRRRSRSRSSERYSRRRSRSRSAERSWSKANHSQALKRDLPHQPPHMPVQAPPMSAFPPFRNEPSDLGPRFQHHSRGVLDRNVPPAANIDATFLDRTVGGQPMRPPVGAFLGPASRHHELAPYPQQGESVTPTLGMHHPNRPHVGGGGGSRMSSASCEKYNGPGQVMQPALLAPPTFAAPGKFDGANSRDRVEQRFDSGVEVQADSNMLGFGVHPQQPPRPQTVGRASRRALLPAPEETPDQMLDDGVGQMRTVEAPISGSIPARNMMASQPQHGTTFERPPDPRFPIQQPLPGVWMMENNRDQQQEPSVFPFHAAPHGGRTTLLIPPAGSKKEGGLCVLMTAVPISLQRYGAVREFFHPLNLEGPDKIKIAVDERGQRTGQVYCKFLTFDDAEAALSYTGREKIYIRACTDEEFENTVDGGLSRRRSRSRERERSEPGLHRTHTRDDSRYKGNAGIGFQTAGEGKGDDFIIQITNIPYKAGQVDLKRFFSRFNPIEIRRLYKHHATTGKVVTSDTAFVICDNEKDVQAALRMHDRRILDRDIRLARISGASMEDAFNRAPPAPPEAVAEWTVRDRREYKDRFHIDRRPSRVERQRSLSPPPPPLRRSSPQLPYERPSSPYQRPHMAKIEKKEPPTSNIDSTPAPSFQYTCVCVKGVAMNATNRDVASFFNGLHISPNGIRILKSTPGVAYVEFVSTCDCEQALKKDRSYIGTQMVSVLPCSKEEMMEAVQKQFSLNGGGGGGDNGTVAQSILSSATSSVASPSHTHNQPSAGNLNAPLINTTSNQPALANLTDVVSSQQQAADVNVSQVYLQQLADLVKQEECKADYNQQMNQNEEEKSEMNGVFSSPDGSEMPPIDPDVVCNIGIPGCVAALHNLPPQITLEEICQLFQGYQLIDDSVRMHYSNTGEPTGDCLLAFATPSDAHAAAGALNGTVIGGQTVRMYVVPV